MNPVLAKALVSGSLAALAVSAVVAASGRRQAGSAAAPLNATSHFLWGERAAAREDDLSMKYTATGFLTNYGATVFWALLYELLGRGKPRSAGRALRDGALVSGVAYVTDYHIVPRRLTPGFELRLPARSLAWMYAALAIGLAARDLLSLSRS